MRTRGSMKNIFIVVGMILPLCGILSAQENLFQLRSALSKNIETKSYQSVDNPSSSKKSPAVAVLYSLLIPGMGELYIDRFDQGKYSFIAEGSLWLGYISYRQYGLWIREDARNFSTAHAGAVTGGKNDQFFVDVSNFTNTYDYNEKKLRDRNPEKLYNVNSDYYWNWDSEFNRQEFRSLRVSSEKVLNNSKFIIGAIIVNHIISAVNAARLTRQYNKEHEDGLGSWWLESSLLGQGVKPDGIKLSVIHRF